MAKKHVKKQLPGKVSQAKKPSFSEKRQRHYAFGFFIGEY